MAQPTPEAFYNAWWFLEDHPMFATGDKHAISMFSTHCLYIMVVKVDPNTLKQVGYPRRNTRTRVWLESGPWVDKNKRPHDEEVLRVYPNGTNIHDVNLDCGGDTLEEAIVSLAKLVQRHYNPNGIKKK